MGCLRRLIRLVILAAIVVVLLVLLLPHFLAQAGNTLLNTANGSANPLTGLAQFVPASFLDKNNQLQISLNGLNANSTYAVTLDPGACNNAGYVNVGLVTSDSSGNVTNTFKLSSLNTNSGGWFVDVHSGPSASDPAMACSQLNTNDASVAADATRSVIQLSPVANDQTSDPVTTGTTTTTSVPKGFPQTGVAPGGSNSYDNNVYPRKY